MDVEVRIQRTPNPNAMKFVVNKTVKAEGKATFRDSEGDSLPLVRDLMKIPHVEQVHLFENVITVSQTGEGDWDALFAAIEAVIRTRLPAHDATEEAREEKKKVEHVDPMLKNIDEILDRTVRPGLQADGGDIELISYQKPVLTVNFQGACGGCPSSTMGTLYAIEGILKAEFEADIEVRIA